MTGELRALGLAHGLLLGMVLGSPIFAPALLPWGMEALFIVGGFQLRLADRRANIRNGWRGWISHVRMAPARLIPWSAAATVALITGDNERSGAILIAAVLGELLLYPACAPMLMRLPRRWVGMALLLVLTGGGAADSDAVRYSLAFIAGIGACVLWLRGPDADLHAAAIAAATMVATAILVWFVPVLSLFLFQAGVLCATLTLAHISILRRRPLPFQTGHAASVRPPRLRFGLRPF